MLEIMLRALEDAIRAVRELPEDRQEQAAKAIELVLSDDGEADVY